MSVSWKGQACSTSSAHPFQNWSTCILKALSLLDSLQANWHLQLMTRWSVSRSENPVKYVYTEQSPFSSRHMLSILDLCKDKGRVVLSTMCRTRTTQQLCGAEEPSEKATTEPHLSRNQLYQKAEVSVQCNVPLKSTMSTLLYCLLSEAKPEGCT